MEGRRLDLRRRPSKKPASAIINTPAIAPILIPAIVLGDRPVLGGEGSPVGVVVVVVVVVEDGEGTDIGVECIIVGAALRSPPVDWVGKGVDSSCGVELGGSSVNVGRFVV